MPLIRHHRGSLNDSMATAHNVNTFAELCAEIVIELSPNVACDQIHIEPYGEDDRINWDTYIITVDGYGVFGYSDGPLPPTPLPPDHSGCIRCGAKAGRMVAYCERCWASIPDNLRSTVS